MKALFLHNSTSGKGISDKKLSYIKDELAKVYERLDFVIPASAEEFISRCKDSCGNYDHLLISGGDGSINMAVNTIAKEKKRPVLGFFPSGTCNDIAKNYGIDTKIKRCVRIIRENHVESFDILRYDQGYAVFAMALGGLSAIPYLTGKKEKRRFGALAYYVDGMKKMFSSSKVQGKAILEDGREIPFSLPFVVILNTSHIGGYNVNPHSDVQDGLFDVFLTKRKGQLSALIQYVFHDKRIPRYQVRKIKICTDCKENWDIDGERGPFGDMEITCIHEGIEVLCPEKR